jgi:hypothetical protein
MEETPVTIETMAKKEPEARPASAVVDQKVCLGWVLAPEESHDHNHETRQGEGQDNRQ